MNDIIMYGSALIAVIVVVIMLIKKMDIKITLFAMGLVLMYIAIAMGNPIFEITSSSSKSVIIFLIASYLFIINTSSPITNIK